MLPTIHEEVTWSPLSPIHRPSSLSPVSPCTCSILKNPSSFTNTPMPSPVRQSRSHRHITIISDVEREKREAHPLSRSLRGTQQVRLTFILLHIANNGDVQVRTGLVDRRTKSIRNTLAAAFSLKRLVPTAPVAPIPILKAPTPPPHTSAPAPVADPIPDTLNENIIVKLALSDVIEEILQSVHDPETGTGPDTAVSGNGDMLSVPLVDWRGRLDEDELSRYYPKEHAKEQWCVTVPPLQAAGTTGADEGKLSPSPSLPLPPSIAVIVSHKCP